MNMIILILTIISKFFTLCIYLCPTILVVTIKWVWLYDLFYYYYVSILFHYDFCKNSEDYNINTKILFYSKFLILSFNRLINNGEFCLKKKLQTSWVPNRELRVVVFFGLHELYPDVFIGLHRLSPVGI